MSLQGDAPVSIRRRGLSWAGSALVLLSALSPVAIADGGASYEMTLLRDIDAGIGVKVRFAASRPRALGPL